jgi:hypothetical protein
LAVLLLVCGFADPFDGTEHEERPVAFVTPKPELL